MIAPVIIKQLGPLGPLVGIWEGEKGHDTAPSDDRGTEINLFLERMTFVPIAPVQNHEQNLYGLRYSTMAWKKGEENPFHEELGYWLWDSKAKQVMRCFMVPRGVTVIAGGTVAANAKSFTLSAKVGVDTYGICSNKFLDKEFKTVRYDLKVTIKNNQFRYEEDTQLKIKGQKKIFHHIDKNILKKIR